MIETNIDKRKINIDVFNRIRHRYRKEKEDIPNKLVITSYMNYGEHVTMGDLFYYGLNFLVSDHLANIFYKEIILSDVNSKTKDERLEEMFLNISKNKVDILIKYMELNMIYQQYKKITLTKHGMLKMVVRFLTRDFIVLRDKLNAAIKFHMKYGDKKILVWGVMFIIRDNNIITCYYPTGVTRKIIEEYGNGHGHGLDEMDSLIKTLDKIKKLNINLNEEKRIGGELVCQ